MRFCCCNFHLGPTGHHGMGSLTLCVSELCQQPFQRRCVKFQNSVISNFSSGDGHNIWVNRNYVKCVGTLQERKVTRQCGENRILIYSFVSEKSQIFENSNCHLVFLINMHLSWDQLVLELWLQYFHTLLLLEGLLSLPRSRRNGQHSKMADKTTV